jgi:hypothetical protein
VTQSAEIAEAEIDEMLNQPTISDIQLGIDVSVFGN